MPQIVAERFIDIDPETAFGLSQSSGSFRLRWDPFIHSQQFLGGAGVAAKGVRTRTRTRLGLLMVSEYVSYLPPRNVGMKMVQGPWFFEQFGGGWRFAATKGGTKAVWKYTYSCKPGWLRWIAEPVAAWILGREIERRMSAFARACQNPALVAEFKTLS
ncbi:polyketide cyclase [Arthrobacter alpinus]|uniref:Polyketide cyclase n=1 Tax=Arthrobacter alpinus TaxID=656366 RepID=A0A0M4QGX0_9MICC|nr:MULTISPECIES: SRPBCC family protein [Arthrobacter]ALE92980.1 polyketide cyclase [Arthrobacter alpinus]